jgi:hypothetical protein
MNKCLNCGYERQEEDDHFVLPTECPECHAIYEKVEKGHLKKEYEKAEAVADQKAAARLGSTVAKDDLLKKSRANKIILGIITAIVALIIISAWQDNNEKNQREERQRQQAIAADQARVKEQQEQQMNYSKVRQMSAERECERTNGIIIRDKDGNMINCVIKPRGRWQPPLYSE